MKFIFSIILITSSLFAYAQEIKTKFCSPTIEALESKGDIKIINNCGIDEKQIKLEFEKFRDVQRITQREIKFSLKKIVLLFNEYQKLDIEKLEQIQQGVTDSNAKLDRLIDSQKITNNKQFDIDSKTLQKAIFNQRNSDLELALSTIPFLSVFSAYETTSKLIHDSEIYLNCNDLVKVLAALKKLEVFEIGSEKFVLSILDRLILPFHQNCYNEVGSYIYIVNRDDIILKLNSKKLRLQNINQ